MSRRPAARGRTADVTGTAATRPSAVTVRHYCQGIGDCHLLTFTKPDGSLFRMLIDCGIHVSITGGPALVADIVADLKKETGGRIDVLVVTHEHWDHVSGFLTAKDLFKDFAVGDVWMAWTENPADAEAVELDKFKGQALAALQSAGQKLDGMQGLNPYMAGVRDGLQAVLGFQFGAAGERVRSARNAAAKLSAKPSPTYSSPAGRRNPSRNCPIFGFMCSVRRATRQLSDWRKRRARCFRSPAAGRLHGRSHPG
ncbi:MBL fold metallo-hydrolase [Mesorhizobium sp. M1E.F.Ca.ET.041.01.1.1]|uniref:MBL fold metallo-hydrolase n=1 Tax=Mesorhizobium sp. M1E.F.Ca.ET.041.01.1.1 TaxID=2496759 RepID=UPI001676F276|nr:MBL fold metallo-hydrolase [Mesorhizobium sp. M1E.F.Ca.ET.041.01.1.1]